jgi:hypothetical protein
LFLRWLGALPRHGHQLRSGDPLASSSFPLVSLVLNGPTYNQSLEATPGSFVAYLSVGGGALQFQR